MNPQRVITFYEPRNVFSFAVGEVLNSGEIVTRVEPENCRIYVRQPTLYWRAVAKMKSAVWEAWWRIRCAYYDLKDRF